MPAVLAAQADSTPDPEPEGSSRPSFLLLHVPPPTDPTRYEAWLSRLSERHPRVLVVATVVGGATPAPHGIAGPAFVLMRGGRVVAEAFGDLSRRELDRMVDHEIGPVAAIVAAA